ncbi:hypothetical protein ARMSODRAFT_186196 [Armillaria solidipes]|uniref:Uncharacterized protein n=1 Tax=Armillaria solidipes TaxID=1076256 RepID=A0A2H3BCT4_9AGAR|nr:hypothetical protein ARMSODRAFT_186196 [Armillaria solidipes]
MCASYTRSNRPATTVLNGNGSARLWYIIQLFSGSFNQDPDPESSKIINRLPLEADVRFIYNVKQAGNCIEAISTQQVHPFRQASTSIPQRRGCRSTSRTTSLLEPTGYRLFLEVMFPRLAKQFLHSLLAIEDSDIDGANGRVWNDRRIKSDTVQILTTISFFIPAAAETSFPGNDCLFSESQARAYPIVILTLRLDCYLHRRPISPLLKRKRDPYKVLGHVLLSSPTTTSIPWNRVPIQITPSGHLTPFPILW